MSKKQVFVFLGAPGVGKGALSSLCVKKLGWKQFSTGDECRKHRSEGTEIGREIDFAIKSGKLVSDDVIIDMVAQWLKENEKDAPAVILDGFPRTVSQAQGLIELLSMENFSHLNLQLVKLALNDEVIVKRLSSRLMCENKSCQAVYSTLADDFKPKVEGVCDRCGSALIQRDDDKVETIRERLKTYHHHVKALLDFYKNAGYEIKVIDADQPSLEIFENFLTAVGIEL